MWWYLWRWQFERAEQLVQRQHALLLQQFNLPLMALCIIALLLLLHLYGLFIILLLTRRLKVSVCMKRRCFPQIKKVYFSATTKDLFSEVCPNTKINRVLEKCFKMSGFIQKLMLGSFYHNNEMFVLDFNNSSGQFRGLFTGTNKKEDGISPLMHIPEPLSGVFLGRKLNWIHCSSSHA